jgi:hypothetical protein
MQGCCADWRADLDSQGFDRNNFAETEESLKLLKKLGPDVMLVEGQYPASDRMSLHLASVHSERASGAFAPEISTVLRVFDLQPIRSRSQATENS